MRHNAFARRLEIAAIFALRFSDTDRKRLKRVIDPSRNCDIELPEGARLILSRSVPETGQNDLKLDIVLLDKKAWRAVFIDYTVPFEGPNATLKGTSAATPSKYGVPEPKFRRLGYKKIVVNTLVVGGAL